MVEIVRPQVHLDQLYDDVCRAAQVLEVPCDKDKISAVLEAFGPRFQDSEVALRTTNRPVERRDLSVRYVNITLPKDNPYALAVERGFLTPDDHPVYRLYDEVRARFPMIGSGVDSTVRHGMEKIWPFFRNVPIEEIYKLPSIPASVQRYDGYFQKYGLKTAWLFAIDYWHKTMNIYFVFLPPEMGAPHPLETIKGMITDLGFQLPSEAELAVNQGNVMIYLTFGWDSPRCLRASFVIPHGTAEQFPAHLDPDFFGPILHAVPTLTDPAVVGMQTAYTLEGEHYLKAEFDYTGTMVQALRHVVMGG